MTQGMPGRLRNLCLVLAVLGTACGGTAAPVAPVLQAPPRVAQNHEPAEGAGAPKAIPLAPVTLPQNLGYRIRLPQLGIDLPIVEGDGWDPPLDKAAHYPGMKWPGEGGRSFVYAHDRPGMFGPLERASVGQQVQVIGPDGSVREYVIRTYTRSWPVTDTSILQPTDHEELILYTCTSFTYSDPKIVAVAFPAG